jgi:hypothetical protein
MTLAKRKIDLAFQLGTGSFGEDGSDTVDITGLRTSVQITETGGVQMAELQLRVWGMPLDTMQKLTVLNKLAYEQERNNTVIVKAGDDQTGTAVVFAGTIKEAWADASNAPDVEFIVSAFSGLLAAVKPVAPTSFKGPVDADVLFASLARQVTDGAQQTPYGLENSGVTAVLESPYLPGTVIEQMRAAGRAAGCEVVIDNDKRVVAIWPYGKTRRGSVLDVSPETGLVGYPQFTQNGIAFTMLYTPTLAFGQTIKMTSALGAANGQWVVNAVQHSLDAETPGGQWFTRVECYLLGYTAPIIGTPS